ncbi:GNAT family N-acetyltransferase [Spirochaeta cellobiosiphila]|uniref:GNAT family N-acetyltransferase n=1 Tax=Spirochaeta cellobiosiphila TaxID=504483 RepID=UPI000418C812|nr:GNAT family N-acetyltransferase [Spirochaeta cellobiosiphila]
MVKVFIEQDIPEVVEIWNENSDFLTSDGKKHSIESFTGWLEGKRHVNHEIYSFFDNQKIIGFCIPKEDPDISWVKMFALSKDHQGKGLGSGYLKTIQRLQKHDIVQCEVKKDNVKALNFFQENGYKEMEYDEEYKEYILQAHLKN